MSTPVKFATTVSALAISLCITGGLTVTPANAEQLIRANDKTTGVVEMQRSDILLVALPENPSTGYRWIFQDGPSALRELGDSYLSDYQAGLTSLHVGSGGVHRFFFIPRDLETPSATSSLSFALYGPQSRFAPVTRLNFEVRVTFDQVQPR